MTYFTNVGYNSRHLALSGKESLKPFLLASMKSGIFLPLDVTVFSLLSPSANPPTQRQGIISLSKSGCYKCNCSLSPQEGTAEEWAHSGLETLAHHP